MKPARVHEPLKLCGQGPFLGLLKVLRHALDPIREGHRERVEPVVGAAWGPSSPEGLVNDPIHLWEQRGNQDADRYDSTEDQNGIHERAHIPHHGHLLSIRGITPRLLMRWSGASGCTARFGVRATSVHGAERIDSA